jgi:hypothetical protein
VKRKKMKELVEKRCADEADAKKKKNVGDDKR